MNAPSLPDTAPDATPAVPVIRNVDAGAPLRWLRRGAADLAAAPGASLFYGTVLALMGFLLTRYYDGAIGLAFTTGFLLVGPFLAFGLYDLSRRRECGERLALAPTLSAWRANAPSIGFYALMLTLALAVWIRMSLAVVGLFYPRGAPSLAELLNTLGGSPEGLVFAAAYLAAGSLLALFVFSTSAIALPMLLDHPRMDTISAMIVSFRSIVVNPCPMLLWAGMIVAATVLGFATAGLLLIPLLSLIGHATWHAYRDLVRRDAG